MTAGAMDEAAPAGTTKPVPPWLLALFGVLLVAVLILTAATLYRVSQLEDQASESKQALRTAKATKTVVDVIAARQLKSQDIPAKVEGAVSETQTLLNETQAALDATNQAIAATNQTIDETNQLLAEAQAAATKAQQSAATLKQNQQQLASKLSGIEQRLQAIETKLGQR